MTIKRFVIAKDKQNLDAVKILSIGDYVAYREAYYSNRCYKEQITSIEYDYVSVRIIGDKTIMINNKDGTAVISTDYYKIDYFN